MGEGWEDDVKLETEARRQRAMLHTRADTWRTAAAMTCLCPPIGFVCGVVALIRMRGISTKIDRGAFGEVERALGFSRVVVLAGTAVAAVVMTIAVFQMVRFASMSPEQMHDELRQQRGEE